MSPMENITTASRIYAVFILFMLIFAYGYEMQGRIATNFYQQLRPTTRTNVVGTINTTILVISNVVITLVPICSNNRIKLDLLKELDYIDNIFSKRTQTKSFTKWFYLHVIILNLYYFGLLLEAIIMWVFIDGENTNLLMLYYGDDIFRYRISMFMIYVYYFLRELCNELVSIHRVLINGFDQVSLDDQGLEEVILDLQRMIKNVSEFYASFKQIIDYCNGLFGWQLLFVLLNYIVFFTLMYEMTLHLMAYKMDNITNHMILWTVSCMIYALVCIYWWFY